MKALDICPYCDAEAAVPGAGYCYICGSTMQDCSAPHPRGPVFLLMADDPMAPMLVRMWAAQKWSEHLDPQRVEDARHCADAMDRWRHEREHKETA